MGLTVVDANVHLISDDPVRYPPSDVWPPDWPAGACLTSERYRQECDAAGIAAAVYVGSLRGHGFDNRYAADSHRQDPTRTAWVGNLDVTRPDAADTMERQVGQGMAGVRFVHGSSQDPTAWLATTGSVELVRLAGRLGVPASVQKFDLATLPALQALARRAPDTRLVLYSAGSPTFAPDHLGPEMATLAQLAGPGNVHVVVSPLNLERMHQHPAGPAEPMARLVDAIGAARLLWGSFSLFAGARRPPGAETLPGLVAQLADATRPLDEATQRMIAHQTACRLYGLEPGPVDQAGG